MRGMFFYTDSKRIIKRHDGIYTRHTFPNGYGCSVEIAIKKRKELFFKRSEGFHHLSYRQTLEIVLVLGSHLFGN